METAIKNDKFLLIRDIIKKSIYISTASKRYYSFKKIKEELEKHKITKEDFSNYLHEFGVHPQNHSFIPMILRIIYNGLSDSFESSIFSSFESS